MLVTINGEKYVAESIKQVPVNPLADAFRVTGVQQRSDNVKLNRFSFSNWNEVGIGSSRLRRQHQNAEGEIKGQHIGAMRDADAETRFSNAITLPLLNQAETHASPAEHLISYKHFKGELIGVFEGDYASDGLTSTNTGKFNAGTDAWDSTAGTLDPTFNASSEGSNGGATTLTISHAVQSTYGDRLVVVYAGTTTTTAPSGVTYAGVAMTKLVEVATTNTHGSIWYLVNPTTGTNNAVITYASGPTHSGGVVADYYYCNQDNPFSSSGSAFSNSSNDISISDAVVRDDDLLIGMMYHLVTTDIQPGSGQTLHEMFTVNSNDTMAVSYERASGNTSSFSHSYDIDGAGTTEILLCYGVLGAASGVITAGDSNAVGARAFGATVHKGSMYVIGNGAAAIEEQYAVYQSPDAGHWTRVGGTNWPTAEYLQTSGPRVNNWAQRYADILDDGSNLIAAIYEDPSSDNGTKAQVRIGYTANTGTSWTFNAGLVIPCTDTPNIKLLHFNDLYTAGTPQVPILITSDNIYKLDIGNNVFQELLPPGILTGTADEALGAEVGADGKLYISKAGGDILQISFPQQSVREIVNVGPQSKAHYEESDGLVTARQGHANYISGSDPRWLFVAYGGHAGSKNASILAMNYETGAWHSFFRNSTADRDITSLVISTESDGIPRLHASAEGAAACTAFMFEEPLVAAVTGVTQNYKTTGYVEWAEDDLGDPHTSAAVMRALIDDGGTMGSGTTTNYVQLKYGLDGAAYDNVTLGNFLSTAKSLNFDATNNRGVSAKTLKVQLNLFGADAATTNTPQIKEYEIQARNRVSVLRGWEIAIDLDASAEFQSTEQPPNPETVVSNLLTVQNSVTLVPLVVGEGAEAQVEMTTGEWMLELIDVSGGDGLQSGRVSGRAIVVLEEVV